MATKNWFLLFSILFLGWGTLSAQPWAELSSSVTPNFFRMRALGDATLTPYKNERGKGYKAFKRWENYWEPRVFADGSFPPSDLAQKNWESYVNEEANAVLLPGSEWKSLGPSSSEGGYAGIGRINRITFHPTEPKTIFACSAGGGLWKSTDEGKSWTVLTDYLASIGTTGLVIHPNSPNVMYLATGDGDGADTYSYGVLKSMDGGNTWNPTGLVFSTGTLIRELIANPANPDILLVGTNGGLWRTTDGGTNWTKVVSTGFFHDIEFLYGTSDRVVAVTSGGFHRSNDGGATWSQVQSMAETGRMELAVSPANPNFVAVVASKPDNSFKGLYASVDGGLTYSLRSSKPNLLGWERNGNDGGGQGWYDLCIAVSPTDANQVYVGGVNTWRSNDGGITWTIMTHWLESNNVSNVHADHHDLLFQRHGVLWSANDGGLYRSGDGGSSWIDLSNGMVISQIYRASASQKDQKIITGLQDNGTKLKTSSGVWADVLGGDGMDCAIDPHDASVLYGSFQNGNFSKSTDGGKSWVNITPKSPGNAAWITPMALDPKSPSTIYLGYSDLWKSIDRGTTWLKISDGLSGGKVFSHIAVAPSNSKYIYISWENSLAKTIDGGNSWSVIKTPHNSNITSLLVNPTKPDHIYVTFSNYDAGAKVFHSVNGGNDWINLSGSLPNLPANKIIYQNGSNGGLYLGMDVGIYYRDNSLADWGLYNADLPNVEIFDLEIRYSEKKLIAATYGRGLWESPLYQAIPLPVPLVSAFTPTAAANGTSVTITGSQFVGITSVSFGGVSAESFVVNSESSITAIPGNGATGNVRVANARDSSSLPGFTYIKSPPELITTSVTAIRAFSAMSGGVINLDNGSPITARGIVWSNRPDPTIALPTKTQEGTGMGLFTSSMKDLQADSTYYVKAYATNAIGTGYGNQLIFKTGGRPLVTTREVTSIGSTEAICGGDVANEGGEEVTEKGVVWSTSENPTISLPTRTANGKGKGAFLSTLTGLQPNTIYYVRAYAVNIVGTAYGNEFSFSTTAAGLLPTVVTSLEALTATTATLAGNIIDLGADTLFERGIVISSNPNPSIADHRQLFRQQTNMSLSSFQETFQDLIPNTLYYARAYAVNSGGTGYGNQVVFSTEAGNILPEVLIQRVVNIRDTSASFSVNIIELGEIKKTTYGVIVGELPNPTIFRHNGWRLGSLSVAYLGEYNTDLEYLKPGVNYFARPLLADTDDFLKNSSNLRNVNWFYGEEVIFTTATSGTALPNVSTIHPSGISDKEVNVGGLISSQGSSVVTDRGFTWSLLPNPVKSLATKISSGAGIGSFTSGIKDLTPDTLYYLRAYATNAGGTAYGEQVQFRTTRQGTLPTVSTEEITKIWAASATGGGNILSKGSSDIIDRGVVWSTRPSPTLGQAASSKSGLGTGKFVSPISGLIANKTYYVRAFAVNAAGVAYGQEVSFKSLPNNVLPQVTISNQKAVLETEVEVIGGVNPNSGSSPATALGMVWSTLPNPTVNLTTKTNDIPGEDGFFKTTLKNLNPGTTYYVRVYATNLTGTAYSEPLIITTKALGSIPKVASLEVTNIKDTVADFKYKILSTGAVKNSINLGYVISPNPNPNINNSSARWLTSPLEHLESNPIVRSQVDDISPNTTYYIRAFAMDWENNPWPRVAGYGEEIAFTTAAKGETLPTLATTTASGISAFGATLGGTITAQGSGPVTSRGIVWSTSPNPLISLSTKSSNGSGTGTFKADLSALAGNTTYYARAYATNKGGTAYGNQVTFITLSPPVLTTATVTQIGEGSAKAGGTITSQGSSAVTARGVVWSTSVDPTTVLSTKTVNGSGTGSFTSDMSGLSPNTTYYVRAYATNGQGTGYGSQVSFKTKEASPTVTTTSASRILANSASAGGNVTSQGSTAVSSRGVVWSTSENPTIALSTRTVDGTGTGVFTSELNGLVPLTTYFLRAYATSASGTGYGNQISFKTQEMLPLITTRTISEVSETVAHGGGSVVAQGSSAITGRGVVWSTAMNPTVSLPTKTADGAGSGSFLSVITGLSPGTNYFVRAYANQNGETIYGNQVSFQTLQAGNLPILNSISFSAVTSTAATLNSQVNHTGADSIIERGFVLGRHQFPTIHHYSHIFFQTRDLGIGSFSHTFRELSPNTTYFARAYAINGRGIAYGSPISFQTSGGALLPIVTTRTVNLITESTVQVGGVVSQSGSSSVTARGVVWSNDSLPILSGNARTEDGVGEGAFVSSISGLLPGRNYFLRAYAVNSAGTAYGNQVTFRTLSVGTLPVVSTQAVTGITDSVATGWGSIIAMGKDSLLERGLVLSMEQNPTVQRFHRIYFQTQPLSTGAFSYTFPDLTPGTGYFIRAFGTNAFGTAYGNQVAFTTAASIPNLLPPWKLKAISKVEKVLPLQVKWKETLGILPTLTPETSSSPAIFNMEPNNIQKFIPPVTLTIYPNPTNGFLTVSVKLGYPEERATLLVRDNLGRMVRRFPDIENGDHRVDLSDQVPGIYWFSLVNREGFRLGEKQVMVY